MNIHPYWSYGPDQGMPPVDALDEGRRERALTLAVESFAPVGESVGPGDILSLAKTFEAYLKGDDA